MQNQKSPPELPNSWRTGHAPLMSHLIIARTVGPRPQVFLQGEQRFWPFLVNFQVPTAKKSIPSLKSRRFDLYYICTERTDQF